MGVSAGKSEVIAQLQRDILRLQGLAKPASQDPVRTGLGLIEQAFPGGIFPLAAMHELVSYHPADSAATSGFISGLLGHLMCKGGLCLWVGDRRTLFPAALKLFGVAPERIIFIDLSDEKLALWAVEEALKCDALSAVVGELRELSFTQSRRLQLAVEKSQVTGFIHRYHPRKENVTACVSRWKVKAIRSQDSDLPGVHLPSWQVELEKVRNGRPGSWTVQWTAGGLVHVQEAHEIITPVIPFEKIA